LGEVERIAVAEGTASDISGDGDEFPDAAAALVIALAMQYEVHGLSDL
jgi:hypothetical protein